VSVIKESRLCRGEGQGGRSDAEVLREGEKEVFENNEECRGDAVVVLVVVGERSGISAISASSNSISGMIIALRLRLSRTGLPRDLVRGGRVPGPCQCPEIWGGGGLSSDSSGKGSRPRTGESASGDGGYWIFSKVSLTIGVCGNAFRTA